MSQNFRLPSDIPIEDYPKSDVFVRESLRLIDVAQTKGLVLRIAGGVAFFLHSPDQQLLWSKLSRLGPRVFNDIDFMGYRRQREEVAKLLTKEDYELQSKFLMYYGVNRQIYYGRTVPMIEVFYDRLSMCHTVDLRERLETDSPTIPLVELLLQKLQAFRFADKDVKDCVLLLRSHDLGQDDKDKINLRMLEKHGLFDDWGFHYTVVTNLNSVSKFVDDSSILSNEDKSIVRSRIANMLSFMNEQPKSMKWKMRARVGTKKRWYKEVEDWSQSF